MLRFAFTHGLLRHAWIRCIRRQMGRWRDSWHGGYGTSGRSRRSTRTPYRWLGESTCVSIRRLGGGPRRSYTSIRAPPRARPYGSGCGRPRCSVSVVFSRLHAGREPDATVVRDAVCSRRRIAPSNARGSGRQRTTRVFGRFAVGACARRWNSLMKARAALGSSTASSIITSNRTSRAAVSRLSYGPTSIPSRVAMYQRPRRNRQRSLRRKRPGGSSRRWSMCDMRGILAISTGAGVASR
jgi:hypothetical protein